jgi:F0F1-type ATP synthase alpha subunit
MMINETCAAYRQFLYYFEDTWTRSFSRGCFLCHARFLKEHVNLTGLWLGSLTALPIVETQEEIYQVISYKYYSITDGKFLWKKIIL